MDKNPLIYIEHIQESISKIDRYLAAFTFDEFVQDEKTQDAVIRQLEIIGEAATQLEEEFKKQSPQMPWRFMRAMRNKLIHEYFDVDLEVVWETVKVSLPELKKELEKFV